MYAIYPKHFITKVSKSFKYLKFKIAQVCEPATKYHNRYRSQRRLTLCQVSLT